MFATASLGERLREVRLAQNLTIEDVSARLKLPVAIVEAMERDDHGVLGAAVYARGRLGSYARLLGLPSVVVDAHFANAASVPPPLISATRNSRFERSLQRVARQGIYVVLTATIVLPVIWLATHNQLPQSTTSLTTLDAPPIAGHAAKNSIANAATIPGVSQRSQPPVTASMAPFGSYPANSQPDGSVASAPTTTPSIATDASHATANIPAGAGLQLRFSGDSWVELVAADGHVIERGVVQAGAVREYPNGAIARVAIGDANSVFVLQNGRPLDLTQFLHANVARFTLSSDGKPAPVGN